MGYELFGKSVQLKKEKKKKKKKFEELLYKMGLDLGML